MILTTISLVFNLKGKAIMEGKKMITFALLCVVGVITAGCSSMPMPMTGPMTSSGESQLLVEKETYAMTRQQVIQAITECRDARLRSYVIYGKRFVNNRPADVVVDVTCY
jgi:hypothetical protein